jgi:hypothetical protein
MQDRGHPGDFVPVCVHFGNEQRNHLLGRGRYFGNNPGHVFVVKVWPPIVIEQRIFEAVFQLQASNLRESHGCSRRMDQRQRAHTRPPPRGGRGLDAEAAGTAAMGGAREIIAANVVAQRDVRDSVGADPT